MAAAPDLSWQTIGPSPFPTPAPAPAPASAPSSSAAASPPLCPADADAAAAAAGPPPAVTLVALLSPSFYGATFNVDSADVALRLRAALWPAKPRAFLALVEHRPDLYAPLWIAATLSLVVSAGGQLASWLAFAMPAGCSLLHEATAGSCAANSPSQPHAPRPDLCCSDEGLAHLAALGEGHRVAAGWRPDVQSLTAATVLTFGFAVLAPLSTRLLVAYLGLVLGGSGSSGGIIGAPAEPQVGLLHLATIYGYSLAAFVPAAVSPAASVFFQSNRAQPQILLNMFFPRRCSVRVEALPCSGWRWRLPPRRAPRL